MTSKTNSRRTPRIACSVPGRAEGPRGPVRGVVRSLSQGGLFFTGTSLPVGKAVEFSLDLPAKKVSAQAEVRYTLNNEQGAGIGVRFIRIAQEDLQAITQFVTAHAA